MNTQEREAQRGCIEEDLSALMDARLTLESTPTNTALARDAIVNAIAEIESAEGELQSDLDALQHFED